MEVSIKDSDGKLEIKIDDKEMENVTSYSLSSDVDTVTLNLNFVLPRENVKVQAAY